LVIIVTEEAEAEGNMVSGFQGKIWLVSC